MGASAPIAIDRLNGLLLLTLLFCQKRMGGTTRVYPSGSTLDLACGGSEKSRVVGDMEKCVGLFREEI